MTAPKSGRARTVGLSRRLRTALAELHAELFNPGPEVLVLDGIDDANFRRREWRRILKRADIGHRAMKDLRDTFASQLLTAGIQLGYVSQQLGHSNVATTARHYARWAGGDLYREPLVLQEGEVPADLLAWLGEESPHSPPTPQEEETPSAEVRDDVGSLERETGFEPATLSLGS